MGKERERGKNQEKRKREDLGAISPFQLNGRGADKGRDSQKDPIFFSLRDILAKSTGIISHLSLVLSDKSPFTVPLFYSLSSPLSKHLTDGQTERIHVKTISPPLFPCSSIGVGVLLPVHGFWSRDLLRCGRTALDYQE